MTKLSIDLKADWSFTDEGNLAIIDLDSYPEKTIVELDLVKFVEDFFELSTLYETDKVLSYDCLEHLNRISVKLTEASNLANTYIQNTIEYNKQYED